MRSAHTQSLWLLSSNHSKKLRSRLMLQWEVKAVNTCIKSREQLLRVKRQRVDRTISTWCVVHLQTDTFRTSSFISLCATKCRPTCLHVTSWVQTAIQRIQCKTLQRRAECIRAYTSRVQTAIQRIQCKTLQRRAERIRAYTWRVEYKRQYCDRD